MKIKRVKIGLRPPGTIFREAGQVLNRVEAGKRVSPQREWIYFSDVRAMSKVLTPRRLEILKAVRDHRPESIRALAGLVDRDVKNVANDLALLASLGLVEMEVKDGSARRKAPRVDYETLTLEVHL
jgi:predicted transcriptional regulator